MEAVRFQRDGEAQKKDRRFLVWVLTTNTPETEAKHQASQTAEDIDSGRLVEVGDGWKLAEEVA